MDLHPWVACYRGLDGAWYVRMLYICRRFTDQATAEEYARSLCR